MQELEKALLQYCKSAASVADPAKVASEDQFDKGIGGTKADHVAEKIFSDIVRDRKPAQPDPNAECYKSTLFEQWLNGGSLVAQQISHGKRAPPPSDYSKGRWIRTLNAQETCYLYIHTTTYQMQGNRPENYVPEGNEGPKQDPFASFPSTHVDQVFSAIDSVWAEGKAPLLLCNGDAGLAEVRARLQSGRAAFFLDVRPFVLGVVRTKVKFADQVEAGRKAAVAAMKAGGVLAVDLADVGSPDWKDKVFGVADYHKSLPHWLFDPSAHAEVGKHGQIFRKEDKGDVGGEDWDVALARTLPAFRVVYLTGSGPGTYAKDVRSELLPQNKWSALRVKFGVAAEQIPLKRLVDAIGQSVHREGLVPLVLDSTDNADTFLSLQRSQVLDFGLLAARRGVDGGEAVKELMRERLVAALKHGSTLVLRLGEADPDLLGEYSDDDFFPVPALFDCRLVEVEGDSDGAAGGGGITTKGVFSVAEAAWAGRVYRECDKEAGGCVVRDGFSVVVTSRLPADLATQQLASKLPLSRCKLLTVVP